MKTALRVSLVLITILFLLGVYIFSIPPRPGTVGPVSVGVLGFTTNSANQRVAQVAVTNRGAYPLLVAMGIQIRGANGWQDPSGRTNHMTLSIEGNSVLEAAAGQVMEIADPQRGVPWRAFAFCQEMSEPGWKGIARNVMKGYVLKQMIAERFETPELPASNSPSGVNSTP